MKAFIKWPNGHTTTIESYFQENTETFEKRVLKAYGNLNCRIMLSLEGSEDASFYIK